MRRFALPVDYLLIVTGPSAYASIRAVADPFTTSWPS